MGRFKAMMSQFSRDACEEMEKRLQEIKELKEENAKLKEELAKLTKGFEPIKLYKKVARIV